MDERWLRQKPAANQTKRYVNFLWIECLYEGTACVESNWRSEGRLHYIDVSGTVHYLSIRHVQLCCDSLSDPLSVTRKVQDVAVHVFMQSPSYPTNRSIVLVIYTLCSA